MVRDKKKDVENRIFAAKSFEEVSQLKEERLEILVKEEREELEVRKQLTSILLKKAEGFLEI